MTTYKQKYLASVIKEFLNGVPTADLSNEEIAQRLAIFMSSAVEVKEFDGGAFRAQRKSGPFLLARA